MRYSPNTIEEIRIGNDIIDIISQYTKLKKNGNNYMGLCPFHKENTPSFSVSPDKQLYHCFGCGASGNVISFIMQTENYDFVDTIKYLAERINYDLPEDDNSIDYIKKNQLRDILLEIHTKTARYFYDNLSSQNGNIANTYLDKRQVVPSIRKKYGLGYASSNRQDLYKYLSSLGYNNDILVQSGLIIDDKHGGYYDRFYNRLMFPIIDIRNRIIGFGGRTLEEGEYAKKIAKYLNSPETLLFNKSHNLYSINFARQSKIKEFILVEGYMDVISLYQAGFYNVVAALGTAFNDNHARTLKKYADSVIILFDSDEAGTKATLSAIPVLISNGIRSKVLQVKDAKDPDEYIKKFGREAFANLLTTAKGYVSFQIECKKREYNLNDTVQRIDFTKEVAKLIKNLDGEIEREVYIDEAAKITGISKNAIESEVKRLSESITVNMNSRRYMKEKYSTVITGIDDARQSILYLMATKLSVYYVLKSNIKKEEFIQPVYMKLLDIIDEMHEKKQTIYPAEIVSFFEDIEEQTIVSKIFMLQLDFEDTKELEKAINDQLKIVKRAYIDTEVSDLKDISRLQKLIEDKRAVDSLNILLTEG